MDGCPAWTIAWLTIIVRVTVKKTLTQARLKVVKPDGQTAGDLEQQVSSE